MPGYWRRVLILLCFSVCALTGLHARADTDVELRQSFAGNLDFDSTGGTFIPSLNSCTPNTTASAALALPVDRSAIVAAYLYYAGSTNTLNDSDADVTLQINGVTNFITADRTFTSRFVFGASNIDFYGGFEDITLAMRSQASNANVNTNFTMSDLSIFTGAPHCPNGVLGGFAIVVIYEDPTDPLRVINVFDGFQQFRFNSLTLTPSNFVIPATGIDGKQLVITWEGDDNIGDTEGITYNTTPIPVNNDPFNVGNVNDSTNDFNSTISAQGATDVFGVDVDTYDLSTILQAGQTSGSTVYTAGSDLVFLTAEVISVTNTAVSDLSVTKSGPGTVTAGNQASYTLSVTNNGPNDENGTITVTDDISGLTGVTFVSATGTDWSCSETGGVITCDYTLGLADGATVPNDITVVVDVAASAAPSFTNTASVSGVNFDNVSGNDADSVTTTVLIPDLSTSAKVGVDETGGDLSNGESVLYTITLTETAGVAASNVTVTDDLDPIFDSASFVEVSAGTGTGVFDPAAGSNGRWTVSGITISPGGSVDLQFRANVSGASAGDTVQNTAVVDLLGVTTDLVANTFVVDQSTQPASGDKPLYFQITNDGSEGNNDSPDRLTRALLDITGQEAARRVELDDQDGANDNDDVWVLLPDVVSPLVIDGDLRFDLWMTEEGNGNLRFFTIDVERVASGGGVTVIGSEDYEVNIGSSNNSNPVLVTLPDDDNNGAPAITINNETIGVGEQLQVRFTNTTSGGSNRRIRIFMQTANEPDEFTSRSKLLLPTTTVINVDSTGTFDAPITNPGSAAVVVADPGDVVYLRTVISDPFGDFDIGGATVTIQDANGADVGFVDQVMVDVSASDPADTDATKTFEVAYTVNDNVVPPAPFGPTGDWTFTVTAEEGDSQEGVANQIFDTGVGVFEVGLPDFLIMKSSPIVYSDPVNTSNFKRIPGAVIGYDVNVSNQGRGRASPESVVITDNFPAQIRLGVPATLDIEDSITFDPDDSGLTFVFGDDVNLLFDGGGSGPAEDADNDGCYDNVAGFVVTPSGQMERFDGSAPSFTLSYRACIQ